MVTNETFLKILFHGDESHVEIKGNGLDLATAITNCILENDALQAIVLTGLAGAIHESLELMDKFNQIYEMIVIKHKEE